MIQPEEIRRKAEKLYTPCLSAWLTGNEGFFPYEIRARKTPRDADIPAAIRAVSALRENSKEFLGYGYSVGWQEVNSKTFGRNKFPSSIFFETREDLLRFIGKQREFDRLVTAVEQVRQRFPQLEGWLRANPERLIQATSDLDGLFEVLNYFCKNPRPNCFARELPLTVDSKFIERHLPLLGEWFDLVLPSHTIRADEQHFERRYGLRYAEPHILVRLLDADLQTTLGVPFPEFSLPLHAFARWQPPVQTVFIVENKVNLLTFPPVQNAMGIGALGSSVTLLRYADWLGNLPLFYWGDIDVEGFRILSALRSVLPTAASILMDLPTLEACRDYVVKGNGTQPEIPLYLTQAEELAFLRVKAANLRLEQERVPLAQVHEALADLPR